MIRRTATALAFAAGVFGLAGCTDRSFLGSDWASVGEALGWEKVKTPKPPKIPAASIQTAERVETLGRWIIAQNTFTGLEPLFHTIGVPEPVLFHRGTAQLYISEGLVKKCKTDAELAAVLCSELGQMMAEQRAARGAGRDKDPIAEVGPSDTLPGGEPASTGSTNPRPASAARTTTADPAQLARDLLHGAGFDPAELDRVTPLVKQSDCGELLRKQMAGSAPAPKWEQ